jgi:hypothetical protein
MNSSKLAYFIVLGVLAFGLTTEYQKGNLPVIHRVVGVVENSVCQLVAHAEQTLAAVQILTGHPAQELRVDDEFVARRQAEVERAMAEHQSDLDRVLAEHQANLDRAVALRQSNLECLQRKLNRMQVVLDRAQVQKVRVPERAPVRLSNATNRRTVVVCPRTGAKITVNTDADLADLDTNLSGMEVGDSF